MSEESKPKRRSAPKSRTGCLTCRTRRVKCDEQTPSCAMCRKVERPCVWKRIQPAYRRPLLPQDSGPLIQAQPSKTLSFVNQREELYFRTYQEEVCLELSRNSTSSAWSHTLLQSCHQEPFVLRAVVTIGALSKAMKQAHIASLDPAFMEKTGSEIAQLHQTFALASYGKAIVGMKQIVPDPQNPSSMRNALLSCLLIYCIEMFLKSPTTALQQGHNGYTLLQQWADKHSPTASFPLCRSGIFDDDLVHEFGRMELTHAMRWGIKDLPRHVERRQDGELTIKTMPSMFGQLTEARQYQALILRRTYHLINETHARIIQKKHGLRHPYSGDSPGEQVDPCYVPELLLPVRDSYINDIHRWIATFDPLLTHHMQSSNPHLSSDAALLQIQALDAEICLAGTYITHECDFDHFYPSFAEIVSLTRHIIRSSPRLLNADSPVFNFPDSIEKPLYDVACFCRDKIIRDEALSLLRSTAHRDPTGTQARMATRAQFLVNLEEVDRLDDNTFPEESRWRMIWILHHYRETRQDMTILCCRRLGYPLGEEYPAKREWKRMTFTEEEAESVVVRPWEDGMHFEKWPPKRNFRKPGCVAWREVHEEMLGRNDGSREG